MNKDLIKRSDSACELCQSTIDISSVVVAPRKEEVVDNMIVLCKVCHDKLVNIENTNAADWQCLHASAWNDVPPVQVISYRTLHYLKSEPWALDLMETMYMDDDTREWAEAILPDPDAIKHLDSNGQILKAGDSVVLIKDLKVKGANFIAKRGTAVRRISLDPNNANHIEGRVNDQHIVILTQYVKKV